jgi:hypothetical protein
VQQKEKMMASMTFDTLKVATRLESAGYTAEQARVQATVLAEVMAEESERVADRFATKADVLQELTGLRADLNSQRLEAKAMNSESKADLTRWVVGVGVLQMALVSALVLNVFLSH